MKVEFTKAVEFSINDYAFTGEGIPSIPEHATRIAVGGHTVAYVAVTGEAWETFNGAGTTRKSQTYYWPSITLCPRAWAQRKTVGEALLKAVLDQIERKTIAEALANLLIEDRA